MAKNKKKRLQEDIDKHLGIPPNGEFYYLFRKHSKVSIAKSSEVLKLLKDSAKKEGINAKQLAEVVKWLDTFKIEIPKRFDVTVTNPLTFPKSFDIGNLPDGFNVTNAKDIYLPLVKALNKIKQFEAGDPVNLDRYTTAKNPLAFRLADGKKFLENLSVIGQAVQGGTVDQETKQFIQGWKYFAKTNRAFSVDRVSVTIVGTAESDFMLLVNPTAIPTLVDLRVKGATLSGTGESVFRLYKAPTVTDNGTPITPINFRDMAVSSVMEAYADPVIAARNAPFVGFVVPTGLVQRNVDLALYLLPGTSLLITIQPSINNKDYSVAISYAEDNKLYI